MISTKGYDVWYTINADHVTSMYFIDWSINCKELEIFNAEGHGSFFRFSNMVLFHRKKLHAVNMI